MNVAPSSMTAMLASRAKDLLVGIEFYAADYVPNAVRGFEPDDAEGLFATETATFNFDNVATVDYAREVFEMPSLSRNMGKQSNSVTVKLSNVPKSATPTIRPLALFVLNNEVEGMRMVIRLISRALLGTGDVSWVLFVGKCAKADGFDRKEGSITARQDLGQIEAMIPPQVFQKDCPLDFGGTDCLGTEALVSKNAAFQTAFATFGRRGCNKTFGACTTFANTEFFQGIHVLQIPGSFRYKPHHGLLYKLIRYSTPVGYLASRLFGKKAHNVGQSLEDGTPYGQAIPVVLGRWQMQGIPLEYRDDGETIHFKMAWARGPIDNVYNLRCNNPEFVNPPVTVVHHYGNYGGEANQLADTVFPDASFHSRLAYSTGGVIGSNIEVEDPAPDMSAMIAGVKTGKVIILSDSSIGEGTTDTSGVYTFVSLNWSDNPVDLAMYILTEASLLNLSRNYLDQSRTAKTSIYAMGAIRDTTNAERLVLPNTEIGKAGVDYFRYNSTGYLVISGNPLSSISLPMFAGPAHEVLYEYYDPSTPPSSVAVLTRFRRRYTCNIALTEQAKAVDVLYDKILPTFRGFLSWDTFGRVGIRSERPADSTNVRGASIVGATTLKLNDILPWKLSFNENNDALIGKLLIGVGLTTSEVRSVSSAAYTADGNSITLATSATGGIIVTNSGANFTGGSSSVAASGTVTIGDSAFVAGESVTVTIDGIDTTYILEGSGFNAVKVSAALGFAINANPLLQPYVVAHWGAGDHHITLQSKQGVLTLSSALAAAHDIGEETIRVMMSFAGKALTAANTTKANVLDGTFKYQGGDGQTRYNQFKGTFHDPLRDFAEQNVIVNDYDHQEQIGKVNPYEIDLSAVDSYNQASRLLNGAASKYGDLVDFFSWSSNGLALQLEEGDVICISDDSAPFINQPVRIESLSVNSKYEVSFKGRQYATSAYDDFVEQTDVPLATGTGFAEPPATISFNTTDFPPNGLVQSTDGSAGITSIRGGAIFPTRRNATYATVRLIKRAGVTVNEQVSIVYPDDNLEAVFEFIASADGLYTVELEVCNQWGCNATKPTADIVIGFGSLFGIAKQGGILILKQGGMIMEKQHG